MFQEKANIGLVVVLNRDDQGRIAIPLVISLVDRRQTRTLYLLRNVKTPAKDQL